MKGNKMFLKTIHVHENENLGFDTPFREIQTADVVQILQPRTPIKVIMYQEHYFQLLGKIDSYERELGLLKETPVPIDTFSTEFNTFMAMTRTEEIFSKKEYEDAINQSELFKLARAQMSVKPYGWLGYKLRSPTIERGIKDLARPLKLWINWLKERN